MAGTRIFMPHDCPLSGHGAWIYFISDKLVGPIKIGRAWSVRARMTTLQMGNPRSLYLIGAIYVKEDQPLLRGTPLIKTRVFESTLHARFANARLRGEWFEPVPDLIDYIAALPSPLVSP